MASCPYLSNGLDKLIQGASKGMLEHGSECETRSITYNGTQVTDNYIMSMKRDKGLRTLTSTILADLQSNGEYKYLYRSI